ncbi:MAG: hypothetical protein HFG28_15820 [Eubacterium sp.]|nr:hypothetical protein [Eubacterium sp.]
MKFLKLVKNHMVRLCNIAFCILLLAVWLIGFIKVNSEYPQRVDTYIGTGESFSVNNITCVLEEARLFSGRDFIVSYGTNNEDDDLEQVTLEKDYILISKLCFSNATKETQMFTPLYIMAQSGAWRNGVQLDFFYSLNKTENGTYRLVPNEALTLYVPFVVSEEQFLDDSEDLAEKQYELLFSIYPKTQRVEVELS